MGRHAKLMPEFALTTLGYNFVDLRGSQLGYYPGNMVNLGKYIPP
jgi:hypothetical protein